MILELFILVLLACNLALLCYYGDTKYGLLSNYLFQRAQDLDLDFFFHTKRLQFSSKFMQSLINYKLFLNYAQ